jgi:glycosyltransferase involved in cell wall biosynthesis
MNPRQARPRASIMQTNSLEAPVTLIGHPFATVGMGEQLRSHIAACQAVHLPHWVVDIFRYADRADPDHVQLVGSSEVEVPPSGIRIFHINGDEVETVQKAFADRRGIFADGYNIIVPAWELPRYPAPWAEQLRKFDEVWALSHYIAEALLGADIPSTLIGQAVEVPLAPLLPRRYFGIRESAFTMLQFFDLTSYSTRKNPGAVLDVFEALRQRHPFADIQLVLKVKRGDASGEAWLQPMRERLPEAVCLAQPLTACETRSLINCCDCFVSLHRAEGFGRSLGEAMFLGRLALGTAWSGNLDYMTEENSLLVRYRLVPIGADEYPHCEGQVWAEPDLGHAIELLERVISEPERAGVIAAHGRQDIRLGHGYRAVGSRILARVQSIQAALAGRKPATSRRRRSATIT